MSKWAQWRAEFTANSHRWVNFLSVAGSVQRFKFSSKQVVSIFFFHLSIHLFVCWFVHSINYYFFHSFIHSFIHSLIHSFSFHTFILSRGLLHLQPSLRNSTFHSLASTNLFRVVKYHMYAKGNMGLISQYVCIKFLDAHNHHQYFLYLAQEANWLWQVLYERLSATLVSFEPQLKLFSDPFVTFRDM